MTDRQQMQDDIERALGANRPGPKPTNMHVFPVTVLFSHLFLPQQPGGAKQPEYFGVTFSLEDVPEGLTRFVTPREWKGRLTVTARCRVAPTIVSKPYNRCALDTTLRVAKYHNISPDSLLKDARVELGVEAVEYTSHHPVFGGGGRRIRELQIRAVRVDVDAMVDTFDKIMEDTARDMDAWMEDND